MSEQLNVYEAKTRFSQLLDRVEAGEEIVIARNGRPVARLVPAPRPRPARTPGALRNDLWIAPDFDEPDPATAEAFETSPVDPR